MCPKDRIVFDDMLILSNGLKVIVGPKTLDILNLYYTDNLECPSKPDCTVLRVERPTYKNIFNRDNIK